MDSPQSVVSPLKNSFAFADSPKQSSNLCVENSAFPSNEGKRSSISNSEDNLVGSFLEVYVHQARDIHNICIYQKQDVYAKLCLTTDPENSLSTKIINAGGRNPIFNENLRFQISKVDSSLKCEIWMLSRVKNYLEDQLLGFALVPLSDILIANGKLEKEFSLSSTDLFHSPAGFVQLSISYIGSQPEVFEISNNSTVQDMDSIECLSNDLDKVEFPDPKVVNENHQMVEEYISMPCSELNSQCSDSQVSSEVEVQQVQHGESFSTCNNNNSKIDSPPSSVSTHGDSSASPQLSSQSCETPKDAKSSVEERISPSQDKEKSANGLVAESKASIDLSSNEFIKPIVPVEPEMVQQDIVDMYMKSMQQFTESLSKMKLPVDFETGPPSSSNSSSDPKSPTSKNPGSRVFYGSRAFF